MGEATTIPAISRNRNSEVALRPLRGRGMGAIVNRWCRCAQPPANRCNASGVKRRQNIAAANGGGRIAQERIAKRGSESLALRANHMHPLALAARLSSLAPRLSSLVTRLW